MVSYKPSDAWGTPQGFVDRWAYPDTTVDAAANASNHKFARWWGPDGEREDALEFRWEPNEVIWCNPPYSRGMQRQFAWQAVRHAHDGGTGVMLLPADTSTELFHWLVEECEGNGLMRLELLKGRVRFEGAPGPAKFGSMVIKW